MPIVAYPSTATARLEVFDGMCGALNALDCNDDSCGLQSSVTVASTTGQMFFVRVAGFNDAFGDFELNVTCTTPPSNDDCTTAITIVDGANGPFSNVLANSSAEAVINLAAVPDIAPCSADPALARQLNDELPGEVAMACADRGLILKEWNKSKLNLSSFKFNIEG